jgi:DNA-binding NarL/FixJ family response regulator
MKIRILVVDDHEIVRRVLKALINRNPDWEVCGEASNGKEALEKTMALNPDVIVMDVMMPVMNGLDAAVQIRQRMPSAKIVLVSMYDPQHLDSAAARAGADAYIAKTRVPMELPEVIDRLVDASAQAGALEK